MKNLYLKQWRLLSALFLLMCISPHMVVRAQSSANYAFTTNTSGSLVDMSSGTTQLIAPGLDATASAVTPIGFPVAVMGNVFTQFSVNEDAIMQLGSTPIGVNIYTINGGTPALPRLAAFNADLRTGTTTGKVHYKVTGTAPNRQLVVEFLNMHVFYNATAAAGTTTFQMVISETTGKISYIYGAMNATDVATGNRAPSIGFYAAGTTNGFISVNYSASTASVTSPYTANPNIAAIGDIANLNSTANGSRRVYEFTSITPNAAPSGLSFSAVTATSMTLNWTDNATNELGYAVLRSTDGINYVLGTQVAANAISANITGLSPSTNYFWKVYAITEGAFSTPDLSGTQATVAGTLSGIKTVGASGDYTNLTTAFAAINSLALSGDVELQLISGYPAAIETYPIQSSNTLAVGAFNVKVYPMVSGLSITSNNTTGTLNLNNAKNLTFDGRVNQAGGNDLVIANTNAGTSYAILLNNDAQNNTIKNTFVQSTNTSTGSGTIVFGTTNGANGNDNNTVDNCDIRDGATTPINGIYSSGSTGTAAQFNDNNVISNNRISNFFSAGSSTVGVFVGGGNSTWTIDNNRLFQTATRTYTTGNTHNGIQISNTTGNGFVVTGNTIGFANAAGTGTYTLAGTVATRFIGINVSAGTTATSSVQGNTISGISLVTSSGAATANGILTGINVTAGNVNVGNVTPNTIGATTGIDAILTTASTSTALLVGINSSSAGTVNISNNNIGGLTSAGSTTSFSTSVTGIQVSAGTPTINGNNIGSTVTANSINASTVATGSSQLVRGIDVTSGVTTLTSIQSNFITNLNQNAATTGSNIRGISYAGTGLATISQNTVSLISGANANTAVSGSATGIQGILHTGAAPTGAVISNNTVHSIYATNPGAVQTNVNGIGYSNPTTGSVTSNKVYNLRNSSTMAIATTPPTASGILIRALGTSVVVANNMISLGDVQTTNTEFVGIWNSFSTVGVINIYNNSVSISGTAGSGALPSFGVLRGDNSGTAVTTPVDIRNNIISNIRSGGTGKHYAIANQSTAPSATGWGLNASNYNMLNATAATVGLWGSTDLTFNNWRLTASSDANSFSGLPVTFVNISTGDLHLNMGVTPTPIESGGTPIAAVTTDYDSQVRPGPSGSVNGGATSPDLGADEFDGAPALPIVTLNSITPPTTAQCTASARAISVNVTTPVGIIINVSIGYSVNGVAQTPITMTNVSGTTWTGTIPVPTPSNATIVWGVAATNTSGFSGSYSGTSYSDEPLLGASASAVASPVGPLCAGTSTTLTANITKPGSSITGSPSGASPASAISPFYHGYGGVKTQYIMRASELTAMGFSAGNLTALSLNITALGTTTMGSFSISAGHTAQNAAVINTAIVSGLTTVYSNVSQTLTAGVNTYTFSTPFNWDGTSNVVLSFCYTNNNTGGTSSTVTTDPALAFTSSLAIFADNATIGCLLPAASSGQPCMGTNSNGTSSTRPTFTLTGNKAPAISSVSWSDGVGTVGITNPLSVTPTTTTTYTATVNALGCIVTPAPTVTVTVNPLPTAVTATNSAQCGVQVPTASVTSTTGAPTPTFKWYPTAVGGVASQTSTSTTYTFPVSVTTTFYVSEVNGVTGCESNRTPVTINVSTPDPVSANAAPATLCLGGSVTLTGANTSGTPFQTYSYSWTGAAGSGAETPIAGASVTVTPTVAGTYVYALNAVDGGCAATANTLTVTVNANPAAILAGVNDNSICNGQAVNLTSSLPSTVTALAQNFDAGFGAWTTTYSGTAPAGSGWVPQNAPYSYTTYFLNFATPQGGGFAMTNGDIGGSGLKTRAALISPTFSTAGLTSATLTFQNLYRKWNSGDSLVRLEISTDGGGSWATLKDYLPLGDQGVNINNAEIPANESIALGAPYLNQPNLKIRYNFVTAWGYYWLIDDVKVIGSSGLSLAWTSSPAGFTSSVQNPTGVNPAVTTNYTVTATNPAGCTSTSSVLVTVNQPTSSSVSATACSSYTWAQNGTTYNTSGAYTTIIPNAAGCDSTITLNLTINQPTSSTVTATACSSYTWAQNGTTYNTSGSYPVVLAGANSNGCDSTVTLVLTINQPTSSSVTVAACSSYTWAQNGTTYNTSGSYPVVLAGANANGCDSTVTLNLTINQPTSSSVTATACGSYTWAQNGTTYNTSGSYPVVLAGANANGCDSTVTLILTINQPTSSSVTATACGSYTWAENGTTYNTSGSYPVVLAGANANGCDSTVTLILTINQPTSSSVTATACGSYTWAENGTTYNTSGSYPVVLAGANANGCDSTVTLILTINQPTSSSVTASACGSYTWAENGTTYNTSGSYPVVLAGANANGCDSTVTLNLTINNSVTGTDVQSACGSFTWIDGITYTASNNTATHTIAGGASTGCDSIVTLNLTINALPTATATDNGDATLTASAGNGYQWINCTTGTAVSGANAQTFAPTANGTYAVVVSNASGCVDTSSCVVIDNVSIKEATAANIAVFPNPTHDNVTITMTSASAKVEVVDAQGKLLQTIEVTNGGKVDLSTYQTGVYFLRIQTENGSTLERVVKN